jgi:CRP-like cAMP-binding protein
MANEIEATIAKRLREANDEVRTAGLAYTNARRRRAEVFAGAAEFLSQSQIAELAGVTQQRVSQVVQEAAERKKRVGKKVPKVVVKKTPRKNKRVDDA